MIHSAFHQPIFTHSTPSNRRSKRLGGLYKSIWLILAICGTGCSGTSAPPAQSYSGYFDRLQNKYLYTIDSVVPNHEYSKIFVYLFNFHDCQPCVTAGLHYAKQLDSLLNSDAVVCSASMVDPAPYQADAGYFKYIYFDADDHIRRELKFVPTPPLLLINKDRKIVSAFMPKDTIHQRYFLKDLLEQYRNLP